jgi:2,4-dienoyl-CoA reductase (NADPH2)
MGVSIQRSTKVTSSDLKKFAHVFVATGVTPRKPSIAGIEGKNVASYAEILSGKVNAGSTVAIIGCGGIGFDVAEFLCHEESDSHRQSLKEVQDAYLESWGVDRNYQNRGALLSPAQMKPWKSKRKVLMLQRKPGKPGETLGKTTGWFHKASLKNFGVQMYSGASYEKITEKGILIKTVADQTQPQVEKFVEAETIVVCAGQESNTKLYDELVQNGIKASLIGGAKEAAELDAKKAILDGRNAVQNFAQTLLPS